MKAIHDSFTIGGTNGHPSMPSARLQRMIGKHILVDIEEKALYVPTAEGMVIARRGDTIILYEDGELDVVLQQ